MVEEWRAKTECIGKHAFATYAMARDVAKRMVRRSEEQAGPYRCSTCGLFHIGHPSKARSREELGIRAERRRVKLALSDYVNDEEDEA